MEDIIQQTILRIKYGANIYDALYDMAEEIKELIKEGEE